MEKDDQPFQEEPLPFSLPKQQALLGHILINDKFFDQVKDKIKPGWFQNPHCAGAFAALIAESKRVGRKYRPTELKESPTFMHADNKDRALMCSAIDIAIVQSGSFGIDILSPELTDWLKARIYMEQVYKSRDLFNSSRNASDGGAARVRRNEAYRTLRVMSSQIDSVDFDDDGAVGFEDIPGDLEEYQAEYKNAITFGSKVLDKLLLPEADGAGSLLPGDMTILLGPQNSGKCVAKGTKILDFYGRIVLVEDIKNGDLLMGPDGKPRIVGNVAKGRGPLYRISPNAGGEPFVCNGAHVLSLKERHNSNLAKKNEIFNIPLSQLMTRGKDLRTRVHLWRVGLDFQEQILPIDPYILGLWLGDGNSDGAALTTMDDEIVGAWEHWVRDVHGHSLSVYGHGLASHYAAIGPGTAHKTLRDLKVLNNKHIPHIYLTSSRQQRLELLAGLIDTDGYLGAHNFEIIQVNIRLAHDIAYLARSLGFKVKVDRSRKSCQTGVVGDYLRLTIHGKLTQVPSRLPRKRAAVDNRRGNTSGFKIEPIGVGDYYGFTLDRDHLYLLGDFTVTHNSSCMLTTLAANLKVGRNAILIPHEGRINDLKLKLVQCVLGLTKRELFYYAHDPNFKKRFDDVSQLFEEHLVYHPMIQAGLTIEEVGTVIKREIDRFASKHNGAKIDLVVDDYLARCATTQNGKGQFQKREKDQAVYEYGASLAGECNFHLLTGIQVNRTGNEINRGIKKGVEERLLVPEDVSESYGTMMIAANVISINRSPLAQARNRVTYLIAKSRSSETQIAVACGSRYGFCLTHHDALGATWYRGLSPMEERIDELMMTYKDAAVPDAIVLT